jgi:hypothetical protein
MNPNISSMNFKRFSYLSALLAFLLLPLSFLVNSCKHDGIPADQFDPICFTEQVLPIFQNSCATCHGGSRSEAGLDFSNYTGIMKAITAGNADKSKAYKAITSTFQLMPPDNALPESKRTIIRLWIEQGAKETTCGTTGTTTTTTATTTSGTLWACYDRDIQPILMSSCAVSGCHNATTHKDGVDFSSYAKTLERIKAGSPTTSSLYNAITAKQSSDNFMPPSPYSPLSQTAIDTIYSWIKRGGLNEECASPCDTTGTIGYTSHIKSIIDLSCASCHGATNPSGGIKLLTASDVQTVAKSGKFLGAVKRKSGYTAMPPAYALSTCEVRQIELWINQGYN